MIKLLSVEKESTNDQIYLTIQVDAKSAEIINQDRKYAVENEISKHLIALSNAITVRSIVDYVVDYIEQEFREFLRDRLFKHYVDMVSINDFIYYVKKAFVDFRENVVIAGYRTTYGFINYEGE